MALVYFRRFDECTAPAGGYSGHDNDTLRACLEKKMDARRNGLRVSIGYDSGNPWTADWREDAGEKHLQIIRCQGSCLERALRFSGFTHIEALYAYANSLNSVITISCTTFACSEVRQQRAHPAGS